MPSPSAIRRAANALTSLPRHFVLSEQVRHALSTNQPLVALESTIITHGLPASVNLRVAQRCESVIEAAGATPATIALLDGRVHVGLEARQLERLASTAEHKGERAVKTARRDLAGVLASKGIGGTTVSATAHLASMAGIEFFATGGIGGVHRGAERTFDISSDLTTLSTTPINLFCSGCKSILSLPLTLEYLETQNVPVYSFSSPRGEFPAFYTAKSGLYVSPVPGGAAEGAAQLIWNAKRVLREKAGALFAVPIPEEYEEEGKRLQEHVERAVRESVEQGVHQRGKEVTPWLLKRVGELSEGRSLESNEALVVNNSEVAARTAVEYWKLRGEKGVEKSYISGWSPRAPPSILILGCAALDISATPSRTSRASPGSTSIGSIRFSLGGVARNMAEAAAYSLRGEEGGVRLVAPLLSDAAGSLVRGMMQKKGMDTGGLFAPDTEVETEARSTPVASLLLDGETNDLLSGVVAMQLVEHSFDEQRVRHSLEEHAKGTRVVGFDANLPVEGMEALLRWKGAQRENGKEAPLLLFEPTSVQKCARFLDAVAALRSGRAGKQGASGEGQGKGKALLDVATPNLLELRAMHQRALQLNLIPRQLAIMSTPTTAPSASADLEEILRLAGPLATLCHLFLVTLGPKGVLAVYHNKRGEVEHQHLDIDQPLGAGEVRSTTGAGDSFAGGVMAMLASAPRPAKGQAWEGWLRTLCEAGSRAAKASLKSYDAVAAPPPSSSVKG